MRYSPSTILKQSWKMLLPQDAKEGLSIPLRKKTQEILTDFVVHTALQVTHWHPALPLLHLWIIAQNFISQPWQVIHSQFILLPWDLQKETEHFNPLNYKLSPTYKKLEFCDLEYSGSLCLGRVREHGNGMKGAPGVMGTHRGNRHSNNPMALGTCALILWLKLHARFSHLTKILPSGKEQVSTDTGTIRNHHTNCLSWNTCMSYNSYFK